MAKRRKKIQAHVVGEEPVDICASVPRARLARQGAPTARPLGSAYLLGLPAAPVLYLPWYGLVDIDENVYREIINYRSLHHANVIRFKEVRATN